MTDTADEPVAVILAGGQGSRLWPISRDRRPKQFQPVVGGRPLLTGTIERLSEIVDPSRIHVSTRARFADAARATLGPVPPENLILEEDPAGPATAFALSIATLAATLRQRAGADRPVRPPHHRGRGLQPGLARHARPARRQPRLDGGARCRADRVRRQPRLHPHPGRGRTRRGHHELLREARPGDDRRARRRGLALLEHRLLRRTGREGVRRLPGRDAARLRRHRALRPRPARRGRLHRGGHRRPRALPADRGRDGVPGRPAPPRLERHRHLEASRARPRRAAALLHRPGGPAREPRTCSSPAWTGGRSSRSAPPGSSS